MAQKPLLLFFMICLLVVQSLSFTMNQREKRSYDDIDETSEATEATEVTEAKEVIEAKEVAEATGTSEVHETNEPSSGASAFQLGSQQDQQIGQDIKETKNAGGVEQQQQAQQQLVAAVGGKHYVLQQQAQLGQQLAKFGQLNAIQQLTDSQQQAIADSDNSNMSKQDNREDISGAQPE